MVLLLIYPYLAFVSISTIGFRKRVRGMKAQLTAAVAILAIAPVLGAANAQGMVSIEKLSFKVADAFEPGAAVSGELRIPDSKRDRLPAVLIVNSSPGFDGRGAFYAEALNQAEIATLEIDMFQGRGTTGNATP